MEQSETRDVIIVGGGLAGLSAAIYLGRALRNVLVIDAGRSLALWEPDVQNYLGFPEGISGAELVRLGRSQAEGYGVKFVQDRVEDVERSNESFSLTVGAGQYASRYLLLATGLYHLPPDIPGVDECLGHSLFFCKDCDAFRVRGKRIAIIGWNDEAVEYALAMLLYSSCVVISTNGRPKSWDARHAHWIKEYALPVLTQPIVELDHDCGKVFSLSFADQKCLAVDSIFTTRGDIYHNKLAATLGAEIDQEGQILVDDHMRTTVSGLYAAGCVTPANCQMIISAGQGAAAAQAINRELFQASLEDHTLRGFRQRQLGSQQTIPDLLSPVKTNDCTGEAPMLSPIRNPAL